MVMDRTNLYLSKPQKAALEKIAKEKGISVAELVRRIIDKELDREQKKGEPLTEVVCVGCGRAQQLRKRKIVRCDGYTCGFGGDSC
jgi:predicted DNA-binding ribbon-helix-helix protein